MPCSLKLWAKRIAHGCAWARLIPPRNAARRCLWLEPTINRPQDPQGRVPIMIILQTVPAASLGSRTIALLPVHGAPHSGYQCCPERHSPHQNRDMCHRQARFLCNHRIHLESSAKSRHPPRRGRLWPLMPRDQRQHRECCTNSCTHSSCSKTQNRSDPKLELRHPT